jgi:hypothetical protein
MVFGKEVSPKLFTESWIPVPLDSSKLWNQGPPQAPLRMSQLITDGGAQSQDTEDVAAAVDERVPVEMPWAPTTSDNSSGGSSLPPRRGPGWLVRLVAGKAAVHLMTQARGISSEKAKRELGRRLQYPSWRTGFADGLG